MLIVDRAVEGVPGSSRMERLLAGLADVPSEIRFASIDPRVRAREIQAAIEHRDSVYIVDNLRLATRVVSRYLHARVVVDVGDEAASLALAGGRPRVEVAALFAAQRFVEHRSRGVIVRGLGHIGALRARPRCPPCALIPDTCQPPATWTPGRRGYPRLNLGFVGSSLATRKVPAGWEMPKLLALLPETRGTAVIAGSGADFLRARAVDLNVDDRLEILAPVPPDQLPAVLADVDVAISTQTTNLAGQVRTTGKLVEYLALGKVVVASRSGTAAALLPPWLTVDIEDVFSDSYVQALADRVRTLESLSDDAFVKLQEQSRALGVSLFSPAQLAPLWINIMRNWDMVH